MIGVTRGIQLEHAGSGAKRSLQRGRSRRRRKTICMVTWIDVRQLQSMNTMEGGDSARKESCPQAETYMSSAKADS